MNQPKATFRTIVKEVYTPMTNDDDDGLTLLQRIKKKAQEEAPSSFPPFADKALLIKNDVSFYIYQIRYLSAAECKNRENTGMYYLTIKTATTGEYASKKGIPADDEYTLSFPDNIPYRNIFIDEFAKIMEVDPLNKEQVDTLNPFGPLVLEKAGRMITFGEAIRPGNIGDDNSLEDDEERSF